MAVFRLRDRTYSVWAHMSKYVTDFTNPFYKKHRDVAVIIPVTNSQSFKSAPHPLSVIYLFIIYLFINSLVICLQCFGTVG